MHVQSTMNRDNTSLAGSTMDLIRISSRDMLSGLYMLSFVDTNHIPISFLNIVTRAGTAPDDPTQETNQTNQTNGTISLLKAFDLLAPGRPGPLTDRPSGYASPWDEISPEDYVSIPEVVQYTIRDHMWERGQAWTSLLTYIDRLSEFVNFVADNPHPVAQRDLIPQVTALCRVSPPDDLQLQRAELIPRALRACLPSATADEARTMATTLVTARRDILGLNHPLTQDALFNQAEVLSHVGDFEEALRLVSDTLEDHLAEPGTSADKRPFMIHIFDTLAVVHWGRGDHEQACWFAAEALDLSKEELGDYHCYTVKRHLALAWNLAEGERFEAAKTQLRAAVQARDAAPTITDTEKYSSFFPKPLFAVEKFVEAIIYRATPQKVPEAWSLSKAVREDSKFDKHESPRVYEQTTVLYASVLAQIKDHRGKTLLLRMRDRCREKYGEGNFQTTNIYRLLGDACVSLGDFDEACEHYELARHFYAHVEGPESRHALAIAPLLATCYTRTGRAPEARSLLYEAIEMSARIGTTSETTNIRLAVSLSYLYTVLGIYDISRLLLQSAGRIIETMPADLGYDTAGFRAEVGYACEHLLQRRVLNPLLPLQQTFRLDAELVDNRAEGALELLLGFRVRE